MTRLEQSVAVGEMAPLVTSGGVDEWVAIVDDHASLRSSLARVLALEGIRTTAFGSAEEYLNHVTTTAPSCVVLDLQLPGMSGHDLAHFLERERPPRPPVVFITGHHELLASFEGCCEVHGRLCKPFDVDAFLALVWSALRIRG